jgi:hypothetical protein
MDAKQISIDSNLSQLAADINALHAATTEQANRALESARRVGELLNAAKQQVPHGQWLTWLSSNCSVSPRQAQRYMKVSDNWMAISKNDAASYLTIAEASKLCHKNDGDSIQQTNDVQHLTESPPKPRRSDSCEIIVPKNEPKETVSYEIIVPKNEPKETVSYEVTAPKKQASNPGKRLEEVSLMVGVRRELKSLSFQQLVSIREFIELLIKEKQPTQ